ncbi:sulfurtransferase [Amphibiibacter pelophylacis]|uniref:Sulfurtransferase n=1 Tax=Amphibiibacter pelophylacis TaxID=1799477 RepID=A0ACC6P4B1_9BURK
MSDAVLISAPDLRAGLETPGAQPPVLLDCRHWLAQPAQGREAWLAGHIPGAHFAHMDEDLSGTHSPGSGRHPLPQREALAQSLARWGITPDSRVVAYDAHSGAMAARAWWLLRWMGVRQVQVLDGGLPAWTDAGGALESGATPAAPGATPVTWPEAQRATRSTADVLAGIGQQRLIDARSADRYRGENETLDPLAGHIPGALNRFYGLNLGPDGRFLAPDVLRAQWAELGVTADTAAQTLHQCGSGVTACHNLLALAHAGLPPGVLYPGSWSAWCSDAGRPRAVGVEAA